MSAGSAVSDLFALENQVGDYRGPRLGYAAVGEESDIVSSPGYTGPLVEREAAMDRYGGVVQLGGYKKRKSSVRKSRRHFRKLKRLQRRKSTHRRRR
jgi:hypothetical protein